MRRSTANGVVAVSRRSRAGYIAALVALALFTSCDGENIFGSGDSGSKDRAPTVRIIDPEDDGRTIAIGDSVEVEVEIEDGGGVVSLELVGLAYRPNPTLGPDIEVVRYDRQVVEFDEPFPRETSVRRRLFPTGDDTSEQVHFIAIARNVAGFEATSSVEVSVGGPDVRILSPAHGQVVQSGGPLNVRIEAIYEQGISNMELVYGGDFMEGNEILALSPAEDSVFWTTTLELPDGASGELRLQALAYTPVTVNPGRSRAITVNVQTTAAPDDEPPVVGIYLDAPERMEMTDKVRVAVTANDEGGAGVARLGITVFSRNGAGETETAVFDTVYPSALRGEVYHEFLIEPFNVRPELPDTIDLEVFAFAVDVAGNCAVSVQSSGQQLPCEPAPGGGEMTTSMHGQRSDKIVVTAGRTVLLPDGGVIADAVVDTARQRLYLSNISRNRVEVLELAGTNPFEFMNANVEVGSQPWGLFMSGGGDTLLVANSGGTNISFVPLDGTIREDVPRRLLTPNTVLYQIDVTFNETTGFEELTGTFIDFSDRPQFIAQDSVGRILYSTVPTGSAPDGTLRVVYTDPSYEAPEVKLLFNDAAVGPAEETFVIANVDSLALIEPATDGDDMVAIWDHVPGFPSQVIASGPLPISQAVAYMVAHGSDIYFRRGVWIQDRIGFSDTTFVSASGDRGRIAFGEGATAPTGRIILWNAADEGVSNEVSVADLISNASERVTGVALNQNGSLGMARGQEAAYYFTPDLRLQGMFSEGLQDGGAGAALHPGHNALYPANERSLAFVGTNRNTISVFSTTHPKLVGEIEIRDRIVGPLRSSIPLPGDNAGRSCPGDPDCVVVKLYGITSVGGVVVVDVRERDLDI